MKEYRAPNIRGIEHKLAEKMRQTTGSVEFNTNALVAELVYGHPPVLRQKYFEIFMAFIVEMSIHAEDIEGDEVDLDSILKSRRVVDMMERASYL